MRLSRIAFLLVGGLAAVGFVYAVSFDRWTVPPEDPALAASVEPTLHSGDLVLLWTHGGIDRGDLVRCTDPKDPSAYVVGRVLGVAGDRIEIDGDGVRTNDKPAEKLGICERPTRTVRDPLGSDQLEIDCITEVLHGKRHLALVGERTIFATKAEVDPGKLWLVSDNRRFHLDSRDFGPIDRTTCSRLFYLLLGHPYGGEKDRGLSLIP